MAFIKWKAEYSVKVKEIDEQHKEVVETINKAHEAVNDSADLEEIKQVLNDLVGLVRTHFSTEEKYFEEFNYEETDEHVEEHIKLTEKVLEFYNRFEAGEDIIKELLDFLKEWLEDHLITMDQKYVKCFQEHGLK